MRSAADITDSLRRTRHALAQQLEHTEGNLEVLGGWLLGGVAVLDPCS